MVELGPLGGRVVGSISGGGLSTEQRKRLTIAVELVANPSIVFMVGRCSKGLEMGGWSFVKIERVGGLGVGS